ncbi:hypothetical protein DPMN_037435 [Dreissena polymorpha]|uniref:Uncharacterized protein n=1 Tax=Dreissena polymorpha TaxID=45954 RepID=A0A9D4MCP7_DREPO|nr:hypothetical protein DPMN_037435 [Dreissena polymorpha]
MVLCASTRDAVSSSVHLRVCRGRPFRRTCLTTRGLQANAQRSADDVNTFPDVLKPQSLVTHQVWERAWKRGTTCRHRLTSGILKIKQPPLTRISERSKNRGRQAY